MPSRFYRVFAVTFIFIILSGEYSLAQTSLGTRVANAAIELTHQHVRYDPAYFRISYPNGDVPADRGVCTDVIIRALRKVGIDLQKNVHEDMQNNFDQYPSRWGLKRPDKNIDHRRVPNLMVYFSRQGYARAVSSKEEDYLPGDIVTWDLGRGITHIGIVVAKKQLDTERRMIVHNIGNGQEVSDFLFSYPITGHYRLQ